MNSEQLISTDQHIVTFCAGLFIPICQSINWCKENTELALFPGPHPAFRSLGMRLVLSSESNSKEV